MNNLRICSEVGRHLKLIYSAYVQINPRANGVKHCSGRKPGARVTNFVLAEYNASDHLYFIPKSLSLFILYN